MYANKMLPGRTTLVFISFASLGITQELFYTGTQFSSPLPGAGMSMECWNSTNITEWSISASCVGRTERAPDKCQWDVINTTGNHRVESAVTPPWSREVFYCSETFGLPLKSGKYKYRILIAVNSWHTALDLQIDDPGEPTLNNCSLEVREGDNVTCTCSTQHEGSPPPVIRWTGHTPSSTLHLYGVTREHNTSTCEVIWGNQTKSLSYNLLVRSIENKEDSTSSLSFEIIGAVAAAVMVIILVTTVIRIFIIPRKRIMSQNISSNSEDNIDELIDNSYYGGSQVNGRDEFEMVEEDYAEVSDSERQEGGTTESSLCANAGTNEKRQTENLVLYANMETKERIETPKFDLCIAVNENKEKQQVKPELDALLGEHHYKGDNSRSLSWNDFSGEEDAYAVIDEDSDPDSHS